MKRLILTICFLVSIALLASSSRVAYLSGKSGVLTTNGGSSYTNIASGTAFLAVDSSTVFYLDFSSTTNTETSVSGTGFTANTWNLTGTNTGSDQTITMDGILKRKRAREFSGSGNYLQNSTSKILIGNYGDVTIEAIIWIDDFTPSTTPRICGNILSGATPHGNEMILSNSTSVLYIDNYTGGVSNFTGSVSVSGYSGKWVHIAQTFNSATNERKIAFRSESLITNMSLSGTGNTAMISDSSSDDNYTDAQLDEYLIGHSYTPNLAVADNGFDGKMSEFRFSNIVRY